MMRPRLIRYLLQLFKTEDDSFRIDVYKSVTSLRASKVASPT